MVRNAAAMMTAIKIKYFKRWRDGIDAYTGYRVMGLQTLLWTEVAQIPILIIFGLKDEPDSYHC